MCLGVCVCVCLFMFVCLNECDTESSKRGGLSPSWTVAPQKLLYCSHFYERTSFEVSNDPYRLYQIGMKTIKVTLFSFG